MRFFVKHLVFLAALPLLAEGYPTTPAEQLRVLDGLLDRFKGRYEWLLIESFESNRPYSLHAPSTPLSDIRYLRKTPDLPVFTQENALLTKHTGEDKFQRSLFLHTSFETPGKEHSFLTPQERMTDCPFEPPCGFTARAIPTASALCFKTTQTNVSKSRQADWTSTAGDDWTYPCPPPWMPAKGETAGFLSKAFWWNSIPDRRRATWR